MEQQPFYGPLSRTTRVSWYQKKHSPTHHPDPDHHPIFISFLHLPRSIASSLSKLRAWQSFCTASMSSLVYLLVWSPPPHIPYISSAIAIPSVCLSVRLSHAGIVSKRWRVAWCSLHYRIAKKEVQLHFTRTRHGLSNEPSTKVLRCP